MWLRDRLGVSTGPTPPSLTPCGCQRTHICKVWDSNIVQVPGETTATGRAPQKTGHRAAVVLHQPAGGETGQPNIWNKSTLKEYLKNGNNTAYVEVEHDDFQLHHICSSLCGCLRRRRGSPLGWHGLNRPCWRLWSRNCDNYCTLMAAEKTSCSCLHGESNEGKNAQTQANTPGSNRGGICDTAIQICMPSNTSTVQNVWFPKPPTELMNPNRSLQMQSQNLSEIKGRSNSCENKTKK